MSQRRLLSPNSACFALLLFVSQAAPAFARAGGGQHFGGHGFSGGGDYGGGGSGLFSLWPLFFFGHSSLSGVIVFFIILYLYQQLQSRRAVPWAAGSWATGWAGPALAERSGDVDESELPAAKAGAAQTVRAGLAQIKERDQNFDENVFLDRAQTAFFKIQQAWEARNQDLARDVMTDSLYQRHKLQTDQLIADHQIDVLQNIVIGNARIVDVKAGRPFDSITVAFTASMTDYTVDEQTRRIVDGSQYPQTFSEYWTFIRRSDARSQAGQTALAATCPSCGAPLQVSGGKCDYCGAYVRTSSADWVVDSISQVA
jgi:predicted lipid-binding transport protein (Tim44 family)